MTPDGNPDDDEPADRPSAEDRPTTDRSPGEDHTGVADRPPVDAVDDTPTVTCTRCDREWDLGYELDDLGVGNQAVEQFALDHKRHTGHFPDGLSTWRAACRQCPEGSHHLAERPARRWAETHARHTRHTVTVRHDDETSLVEPE